MKSHLFSVCWLDFHVGSIAHCVLSHYNLPSRHEYLEDLITKYKKYEEYLLKVLENLPESKYK